MFSGDTEHKLTPKSSQKKSEFSRLLGYLLVFEIYISGKLHSPYGLNKNFKSFFKKKL